MASAEMFNLPNHYSVMRNAFKAMVLNGDYVDVTIWCDRQPIRAHKCILAAASDYFHRIFQDLARQQPQQSHTVIAIQNVRPDDLLAVIKYVYDGQMRVPEMRVNTFMATAQMLGVDVARTVADVDRDDESGVHSESTGSPPGLDVLQQAFKAAAAIPEIARVEKSPVPVAVESVSAVPPNPKPNTTKEIPFETQVIYLLRDMRLETVDQFANKMLKIGNIYQPERVRVIVDSIVDRGIHFTKFATVYVQLCQRLVEADTNPPSDTTFKKLLLNTCHEIFTQKIINTDHVKVSPVVHKRCLGIVRLIGVMYMHQLIFANIVEWIVGALLDDVTDSRLDYLYELLSIVGKRIELRSGNAEADKQWCRNLSTYYEALQAELDDEGGSIAKETRDRCCDLLACRAGGWAKSMPLILGEYGPPMRQHKTKTSTTSQTMAAASKAVNGDGSGDDSAPFRSFDDDNEHDDIANHSDTVGSIIDSLRTFIRTQREDLQGQNNAARASASPLNEGNEGCH